MSRVVNGDIKIVGSGGDQNIHVVKRVRSPHSPGGALGNAMAADLQGHRSVKGGVIHFLGVVARPRELGILGYRQHK